jgi:DNA-binding beta-propeller fold protein YncE
MVVDSTGRLFVNDWWNQRIERINADGTGVMSWGSRGVQQSVGAINFAWDVAQQPGTGNIYVANRENHQIVAYDANGNYIMTIGTRGTANQQFQFPQGVAFDPTNGNLLVADAGNNRIQRFAISPTNSVTWVATYGSTAGGTGPGQFNTPTGIHVAPDGTVWVADTNNNRVQAMSPSTRTWTSFTTIATAGKLHVPWGVTVGPDGNIWITDTGNNRVVSMTPTGQLNWAATGPQMGAAALNSPFQIAFNPVNGYAYISDTFNSRVIEVTP